MSESIRTAIIKNGEVVGESNQPIIKVKINYEEVYDLVGKLLTFVDATFQDKEQRKAMKTLVKRTVYDWYELIEAEQHPEFHAVNSVELKSLNKEKYEID